MKSKAPSTLFHVMEHHAKDKREIIQALALVFTVVLRPKGWDIKNLRGGANSWMIFNENNTDQQWHFRNGGKGCVVAQNHFQGVNATKIIPFRSRVDVLRWALRTV